MTDNIILFGFVDRKGRTSLVTDEEKHLMLTVNEIGIWYPTFLDNDTFDVLLQVNMGEEVKPKKTWLRKMTMPELIAAYKLYTNQLPENRHRFKVQHVSLCKHCGLDIYWSPAEGFPEGMWYHTTYQLFCPYLSKTRATPVESEAHEQQR